MSTLPDSQPQFNIQRVKDLLGEAQDELEKPAGSPSTPSADDDHVLWFEDARKLMGLTKDNLYRRCENKELGFAWKGGKRWCFSFNGIQDWIQKQRRDHG